MPTRIALAIAAAAAFGVTPTFAAQGATHDDTTYPAASATWAGLTVRDATASPAGHDDTVYPGAHVAIVKQAPLPAPGAALATLDDTAYPVADVEAPERAVPTPERLACGCVRG